MNNVNLLKGLTETETNDNLLDDIKIINNFKKLLKNNKSAPKIKNIINNFSEQLDNTFENETSSDSINLNTANLSESSKTESLISNTIVTNNNKQLHDLTKSKDSQNIQKNTVPKQLEDLTEKSKNIQNNKIIVSKQSGGTNNKINKLLKNNNDIHTIINFENMSETQGVLTDLQHGVNKLYTYLSKKLIKYN
jgi:hypothetical protein